MNSIFANMYLEIIERIKVKVPEIKYINQDFGQIDNYEERPPVSFPCLLIDFESFGFSDMGSNCQIAEGTVKLRLATAPFSNQSSITPDIVQAKAMAYYELETKLYQALHGWQGNVFGYLMREGVETEKREDELRVRAISFSTCFQDNSATDMIGLVVVDPTLVINGQTGFLPVFRWVWSQSDSNQTELKILNMPSAHVIVEMAIHIRSEANLALVYDLIVTGANITEANCPNINHQNGGPLYSPASFGSGYRYIVTVKYKTSLGITGTAYAEIWQDPDGNYTQGITDIYDVIGALDINLPINRIGASTLIEPS